MRLAPGTVGHLFLRIGVAFAFLYPPIDALAHPNDWIGYFPAFMTALPINSLVLLHAFGVLEVILALWILSGWKIRIPSAAAVLILTVIIVLNGAQFSILFRDVAIALAALALVFMPEPPVRNSAAHA